MRQIQRTFKQIESWLASHHRQVFWGVLAGLALLALSRRPETITTAQFWAEDGRYWYAEAYNHGWSHILETYAGYFVVSYRLVAQFSLLLPLDIAPLVFNVAALGIQLLPVVLLLSDRLRPIIRYRSLGIVLAFLYIAVPNAAEVFANLTNIQWHLGVASFLILIAAATKQWKWRIFDVAVLIATGLSGPLVIILWPIAFIVWWRNRESNYQRRNLGLLTILSIIQVLSIQFISHYPRVGGQPDADLLHFVKMIVGQVFVGGIFGIESVDALYTHTWALVLAFVAGIALIAYACVKGPWWLRLANLYNVLLIGTMLLSLRPTKDFDTWWGLTNPGGGQRYWYIPILIWIVTVVWLALAAKQRIIQGIGIGLVALLVLVGIPRNWDIPPYPDLQFKQYARKFEMAAPGTRITIPINPGWDMILYKR